jgi:hypothetical protein
MQPEGVRVRKFDLVWHIVIAIVLDEGARFALAISTADDTHALPDL